MSARNYRCRAGVLLAPLLSGCLTPLTGTPLDLTPFGAVFSAVGMLYWLLAAGALWAAVAYSPGRWLKVIAGLIVAVVFGYFPITHHWQQRQAIEAASARLARADAMFAERCKKSGVFIHRTAENVEGVFLMKIRPKDINFGAQYKLDDPYGRDSTGENYLKVFFSGFYLVPVNPPPGWKRRTGYRYVEALDPKDGKRYRYTGSIKDVTHTTSILTGGDGKTTFKTKDFVLDKIPAPGAMPRYGVTYDDISTREERDYWIAGSSLKVIDLQSNEVMAERIGYMMDRGQGNTNSGRSPWLFAADHACPAFPRDPGGHSYQTDQTHDFVIKVLFPKLENRTKGTKGVRVN